MITAEQKAHWETFGFLMLRQLFAPDEVKVMREAAIEVVNQQGGSNSFTSDPGFGTGAFMERHPALANWVDDDRIYDIPETLLGPDFVLQYNGGAVWRSDTSWHGGLGPEERPSPPYKTAKIAMYFDSLKKENGCLRVIPGSHRRPYADRLQPLMTEDKDPAHEAFGLQGPDVPCVALETEPGDVIVFAESTFHASFGSKVGRLQIYTEYIANPTTAEQIESVRTGHDKFKWSFHPAESYINSDRPRIRRMVSRLVELGFEPVKV